MVFNLVMAPNSRKFNECFLIDTVEDPIKFGACYYLLKISAYKEQCFLDLEQLLAVIKELFVNFGSNGQHGENYS